MKSKYYAYILVAVFICYAGYQYLYQGHKDISNATVDYMLKEKELKNSFETNQKEAAAIYANKVVKIEGRVLSVNNTTLTLDGVSVSLLKAYTKEQSKIFINTIQVIKGRCIGYDDLLEEVRIDQASIVLN